VCPSVCHKRCFFFSVSRWNRDISWPSVLHNKNYITLFFDFWFRRRNAQNLLHQICTKSPISRLVWQIDRRCFGLTGGFQGWQIQWNHAKCCEADPCCHGNEIWARRGDLVAYRLVTIIITIITAFSIQKLLVRPNRNLCLLSGWTKSVCMLLDTIPSKYSLDISSINGFHSFSNTIFRDFSRDLGSFSLVNWYAPNM